MHCRAGPKSLVLIDELGRATSTADGVALSWSMSEYLLALGAHVLLATHFRQLEELAALYPSCKLWRMQVGTSVMSSLHSLPSKTHCAVLCVIQTALAILNS